MKCLQLPRVPYDTPNRVRSLLRHFIANNDHPGRVLACLEYHNDIITELSRETRLQASVRVMHYFASHIEGLKSSREDVKKLLRAVPLHITVTGSVIGLSEDGNPRAAYR